MDLFIGVKYDVVVVREESGFDRACDSAYNRAISIFQIDEDGHSPMVGWERSDCSVNIEFKGYKRMGRSHIYSFVAFVEKVS